jgi:hypothetical protein
LILRQKFSVTGVANAITHDGGLKSTEVEKKRLLSVSLLVSGYADNDIQGFHERAKVFDVPDRLIDMEADTYDTNYAKPGARMTEVEIGIEIPVGEIFDVAISCGATIKKLIGTYNYELM